MIARLREANSYHRLKEEQNDEGHGATRVQPAAEVRRGRVPKIGAGELLVRVKACGVCASNLKYVREPADYIILPHILGHEPAGEVVEVGSNVEGFVRGDRVASTSL